MTQAHEDNLIWIDLEMTGLRPEVDHIIEIATLVTDKHLNVLGEGPVLAIHQPDPLLLGGPGHFDGKAMGPAARIDGQRHLLEPGRRAAKFSGVGG